MSGLERPDRGGTAKVRRGIVATNCLLPPHQRWSAVVVGAGPAALRPAFPGDRTASHRIGLPRRPRVPGGAFA